MPARKIFQNIFVSIIKKILAVKELNGKNLGEPKNILIIRQHNQFGDMLATFPLFRAVKERFPGCRLTLIASPENYYAVTKNSYVDRLFVFDKKKLFNPVYFDKLRKVLKNNYDLAIAPATVAVSRTSCLLAGLSDAKMKIGPASLSGKENDLGELFHFRIKLDWRKYPDVHVSDFVQDILRPFGISTKNLRTLITFDQNDIKSVKKFLNAFKNSRQKVIGLHIGAGKRLNRWSPQKFLELMEKILQIVDAAFYFTGTKKDVYEINQIKSRLKVKTGSFIDHTIPELTALISLSDLFITNDTGVMHAAGATDTPQISIFGPTNPYNWAPMGPNKYFVKKSDITDDVTVEDVFEICRLILNKKSPVQKEASIL